MGEAVPVVLPPLRWRSVCGEYEVVVTRRCFLRMRDIAIEHAPDEVGTSLVGKYSNRGHRATVLDLAPLTPDSRGGRWWFIRGVQGLREFFERISSQFQGKRYYVGEWHSHPGAAPVASRTDDKNQDDICRSNTANCPEAILVIVGGDLGTSPQLGVYVYSRECGRLDLTSG